jgi:hypothetical protein
MQLGAQVESSLWTFTGLRGVELGDDPEIALPGGFVLCAKTPQLSAALDAGYIGNVQKIWWAQNLDCFFCLRSSHPLPLDLEMERFQDGLMALQIIKPVSTLGLIFQGTALGHGPLEIHPVQERPTMSPGEWAQWRRFDGNLIAHLRELMPKVLDRMEKGSAEEKNAVFLLQLSLEHFHPLIRALFSVMGLDAVLGMKPGEGRNDFKRRLCERLGKSTPVFPDWNSPSIARPKYTVADVALDLYTLRGKIAHGVDLRKAAQDKNAPVDLTRRVEIIEQLERRPYASLLSEAAVYILCLVLQKELEGKRIAS